MQINVLFFAMIAERLGQSSATLELRENATVIEALDVLEQQHPGLADLREGLAIAVNMAYVNLDHPLKPGDELALIPPVSGG